MSGKLEDIFADMMEDEYANDSVAGVWRNSTFGHMRLMQLTSRGRVGERCLPSFCNAIFGDEIICHTSYTTPELVPEHGSFDALLQWSAAFLPDADCNPSNMDPNNPNCYVKMEVKTITADARGCFQANNVRLDDWDYLLMIGVEPEALGFVILSYEEVNNMCLTNMASTADGNYKLTIRSNMLAGIDDLGGALYDVIESYYG